VATRRPAKRLAAKQPPAVAPQPQRVAQRPAAPAPPAPPRHAPDQQGGVEFALP
jgi:hypothetical protein